MSPTVIEHFLSTPEKLTAYFSVTGSIADTALTAATAGTASLADIFIICPEAGQTANASPAIALANINVIEKIIGFIV